MTTTTKQEKTGTVTDPVLDAQAMEKLIVARIGMLMHNPFFGNIATRLVLKNADSWCPTAATDGRNFYYNSEFINKLKDKELVFLVGHELFHAIYDHIGTFSRMGSRIPMLWNFACDYAVNRDLIEYRVGSKITTVPCLYDKKYDGKMAEEIYDDLFENAEKIDMPSLMKSLLDEHIDSDGEGDGSGEGNEDGSGSGKPKLSAEERQQIQDELKEAMLSAAQAVGAGNVPSGMKRFIDGLLDPQLNWREILQQQIESQIKNDFTFMRPSRRGWGCDAILPSMKKEPSVECHIFLDASGSIGATELKAFLSEVKGIMDQHASFKIGLATFDTAVYNYQEFTEDNADELLSYEPQGGGGTMFECIFDFLKQEDIKSKQLCIFTDMYPNASWGDETYCDNVVFLAYKTDIVAPWGTTCKYE